MRFGFGALRPRDVPELRVTAAAATTVVETAATESRARTRTRRRLSRRRAKGIIGLVRGGRPQHSNDLHGPRQSETPDRLSITGGRREGFQERRPALVPRIGLRPSSRTLRLFPRLLRV